VALTAFLSRWWHDHREPVTHPRGAALQRLALMTVGLAYLQLVLGAHIRHAPADGSTQSFRIAVYFHLGVAAVLAGHALWLALRMRDRTIEPSLQRPALLVALLVLCQIMLGGAVWVVKFGWPLGLSETVSIAGTTVVANSLLQAVTTTAHVAMGSLILATSAWTAIRSLHFFRGEPPRNARVALTWEVAR
jgi:cytochrome c oxidase assembly protein subunit 15